MRIAMMWFAENYSGDLAAEIAKAAAYYQEKYSRKPNCVHVHPSHSIENVRVDGIAIRHDRCIRPKHLWVGIEEVKGE